MAVDFPAPFSPTTPWIVPRSTLRSTASRAWTSPNLLLNPRISTAMEDGMMSLSRCGPRLREETSESKLQAPEKHQNPNFNLQVFKRRAPEIHWLDCRRVQSHRGALVPWIQNC